MEEIIILKTPNSEAGKQKYPKNVNLLLISDLDTGKKHCCVVKNLSRFLSPQVNDNQHKRHFCTFCLNGFKTEKSLENHLEYCLTNECVKTIFPDGEKIPDILKFEN